MMGFEGMLVDAAIAAGMKVPPDPDNTPYRKEDFPHFWVFCRLQLNRAIQWGEHWENAKVIANIPEEKLKTMTLEHFIAEGLRIQT
jgi:hypothetical protein